MWSRRYPDWRFSLARVSTRLYPHLAIAPQYSWPVDVSKVLESVNYERRTCSLTSAPSLLPPKDSKTRVIITQIGSSESQVRKVGRRAYDDALWSIYGLYIAHIYMGKKWKMRENIRCLACSQLFECLTRGGNLNFMKSFLFFYIVCFWQCNTERALANDYLKIFIQAV